MRLVSAGGSSSAPLNGGPVKYFEPVISTMKPASRYQAIWRRDSRIWQASIAISTSRGQRAAICSSSSSLGAR